MQKQAVVLALLGVGVVLSACGTPARADYTTVVYNYNDFNIPVQTDWGPGTPSLLGKDPFKVQLFDPTKFGGFGKDATLVGVAISLHYEFYNTISMRFDNMSTITVKAAGQMHLYGADGKTDLVNSPTFATTGQQTPSPSDIFAKSVTLPTKAVIGDSAMGYTDTATLHAFTGSGTLTLPAVATANSSFTTTSGNGMGTSVTTALAQISVIYFFTVPEPSSLVLTGLGGLGLFAACRGRLRRDRSAAAPAEAN